MHAYLIFLEEERCQILRRKGLEREAKGPHPFTCMPEILRYLLIDIWLGERHELKDMAAILSRIQEICFLSLQCSKGSCMMGLIEQTLYSGESFHHLQLSLNLQIIVPDACMHALILSQAGWEKVLCLSFPPILLSFRATPPSLPLTNPLLSNSRMGAAGGPGLPRRIRRRQKMSTTTRDR